MSTFPRSGRLGHAAPKPTPTSRRRVGADSTAAAALSAATAQWPPRLGYPTTLRGAKDRFDDDSGFFPFSPAAYETESVMSMDGTPISPVHKARVSAAIDAFAKPKEPTKWKRAFKNVSVEKDKEKEPDVQIESLIPEDDEMEVINRNLVDVGSLIQQDSMLVAELVWWEAHAKEEQNFRDCYEAELAAQRRCVNCEMQGLREEMQIVQQQTQINNQMQGEWHHRIDGFQKESRYAESMFKKYELECASVAALNETLRSEIRAESQVQPKSKVGVERDIVCSTNLHGFATDLRLMMEANKNNLMNDHDATHFRDTVQDAIASHLYPLPKVEKLHACVAQVIRAFAEKDGNFLPSQEAAASKAATKIQAIWRGKKDRKKAKSKNDSMLSAFREILPQLKSHSALKDQAIIGIVGGHDLVNWNSDWFVSNLAERCGQEFDGRAKFLTYAQRGVQQSFATACGNGSSIVSLVAKDVNIPRDYLGVGVHIQVDRTVRKALFNSLADIYLLVEVGAEEALTVDMVLRRGGFVVPVAPTRGFPHRAWEKPSFVDESTWKALRAGSTSESDQLTNAVLEVLRAFLDRSKRSLSAGRM